jgi:hypothetical protein
MARRLAGVVIIDGTDDEWWPESDENVHREYPVNMFLNEGQPAAVITTPDVRWGGECRVELSLTARAEANGTVQIEGAARLFEGTSEGTNDLEEQQTVAFTVPRGGVPAHHRIQLRNTETFGGDHAEIGISFTNSLVEN